MYKILETFQRSACDSYPTSFSRFIRGIFIISSEPQSFFSSSFWVILKYLQFIDYLGFREILPEDGNSFDTVQIKNKIFSYLVVPAWRCDMVWYGTHPLARHFWFSSRTVDQLNWKISYGQYITSVITYRSIDNVMNKTISIYRK